MHLKKQKYKKVIKMAGKKKSCPKPTHFMLKFPLTIEVHTDIKREKGVVWQALLRNLFL